MAATRSAFRWRCCAVEALAARPLAEALQKAPSAAPCLHRLRAVSHLHITGRHEHCTMHVLAGARRRCAAQHGESAAQAAAGAPLVPRACLENACGVKNTKSTVF
jgi:hypothetical protein